MVSLTVESLFTNISLEETINVCCDSLFNNDAKVNHINRIDLEKLLIAALWNYFFNFDGNIYKQIDVVCSGISTTSYLGKCIFMFPWADLT